MPPNVPPNHYALPELPDIYARHAKKESWLLIHEVPLLLTGFDPDRDPNLEWVIGNLPDPEVLSSLKNKLETAVKTEVLALDNPSELDPAIWRVNPGVLLGFLESSEIKYDPALRSAVESHHAIRSPKSQSTRNSMLNNIHAIRTSSYPPLHFEILVATICKYWLDYDPITKLPRPPEKQVAQWIVDTYAGVSEDQAKAIAATARPPGVPSGRPPVVAKEALVYSTQLQQLN